MISSYDVAMSQRLAPLRTIMRRPHAEIWRPATEALTDIIEGSSAHDRPLHGSSQPTGGQSFHGPDQRLIQFLTTESG